MLNWVVPFVAVFWMSAAAKRVSQEGSFHTDFFSV